MKSFEAEKEKIKKKVAQKEDRHERLSPVVSAT